MTIPNQNINDVTINIFYWMETQRRRFRFGDFSQPLYLSLSWIEDDCEMTY